jgi:hypothetical protein
MRAITVNPSSFLVPSSISWHSSFTALSPSTRTLTVIFIVDHRLCTAHLRKRHVVEHHIESSTTAAALHTYTRYILHNTTLTSWLVDKFMERDDHLLENHLSCLDIIVTYQPRTNFFFRTLLTVGFFVFTIKISRKFPRRFLSSVTLTRSAQLQEPKLDSTRHRRPWRRNVSPAKL